ncbi:Gfo/Idh/MocA family oxidoreductase [Cytophagaceae bacterium AH-315-L13]|nr:Gfo/Idh/MocA family oxidoreductase [Cytophagaceae bacterium AH-315-L13]
MVNVGIIGYGYWGPNLVRNFAQNGNCTLKRVVDKREERLQQVSKLYPSIETSTSSDDILTASDIDAVVVATPVFLHFEQAKKALENGKHVLVEKPLTSSAQEASELIEIAAKNNKTIMVDHTFLYTGAVIKIKSLIESGEIGDLQYFDSVRINLGLFQPDINVLWDLAPHDISILNHISGLKPYSVNASGVSHTPNRIENVAYLTVNYEEDFVAHFSCSWTSPVKVRNTLIGGSKKMIVYDDVEPSEKIKVYDSGYEIQPSSDEDKRKVLIDYRIGDIHIPKLEKTEALFGMSSDFIDAIDKGSTPKVSGEDGLEVVKILEASTESLKNNGKEVML